MNAYSFLEKQVPEGFGKIKYIHPVRREDADGLVADVYQELSSEFLFLPPAMLHSPIPELLAGTWMMLREAHLTGCVSRMLKEAVAVGVSGFNSCLYCVESHTLRLREAGADTNAIMIRDHSNRVAALIDWAGSCPAYPLSVSAHAPFSQREAPEIIGTAVCLHYFNRVVNVFLEQSPLPLPSALGWARGIFERLAAKSLAGRTTNTQRLTTASSCGLSSADLPADLQWARTNGATADAFARMAHVVDNICSTFVPVQIRAFVTARIARWNGERLPEKAWATSAVQSLPEVDRPLATLLLLTSFASHRVDARDVAAARASFGTETEWDKTLLGGVAWAAFCAARRASTWLQTSNTAFNRSLMFSSR